MGGLGKSGIDGRAIALLPVEAEIAGRHRPKLDRRRHRRHGDGGDRQRPVSDLDRGDGIGGNGVGLGDHDGDRLALMPHAAAGQCGARRIDVHLAAHARDLRQRRQRADARSGEIVA